MTPRDVISRPIPTTPNPLSHFLALARKENGLRYLIEEYYATRNALLDVLQNAYLKDNRNGAVQAGILRGFRIAFEEIPRVVLERLEAEEEKNKEEGHSIEVVDDTGY